MQDVEICIEGGEHEFPPNPKLNQLVKCPECGRMYGWFGFWAEI